MLVSHLIRRRLKPAVAPALCIALLGYFAYHSVQGERGFVGRNRLAAQVAEVRATLDDLRRERLALEHRVELMAVGRVDRDMLDEQVRVLLNFANPQDVVIDVSSGGGGIAR